MKRPKPEFEISTFVDDAPVIVQCGRHTAGILLRKWAAAEPTVTVCRNLKTGRALTNEQIRLRIASGRIISPRNQRPQPEN